MNPKVISFFLIICFLLSYSCKKDRQYSFSEDDLSWVKFNGEPFDYNSQNEYTLKYLRNKSDTVSASLSAWLMENYYCRHESMPNHYDEFFEEAYCKFYMGDSINLPGAVRLNCYKGLTVVIDVPGHYYEPVIPYSSADTILVDNHIYTGAMKYYPTKAISDNEASFFCFVKGRGYVKIILNDGTLLELIKEY